MKLVIAEKPSVARSLAAVVGATAKKDGYLEGNGYIVSWCIGHLIELARPEAYNADYAKWKRSDLPIFPDAMRYEIVPSTKDKFKVLKTLMNDPAVDTVICATDAGREGELIFRLVYNHAGCQKPIKRLWLSSTEDAAIRDAFLNLRDGREFENLYSAALCRQYADWLVGINATRLFSCVYGTKLNVGRVMSPTLALVVQREAEIAAFASKQFYNVIINLGTFKASSARIDERAAADKLAVSCFGKEAAVKSVEKRIKEQNAPALYDLTTLQRDANRRFGYTAQQTLDYAQSLYEKSLITYPRTDSRYVTDDMAPLVEKLIRASSSVQKLTFPEKYSVSRVINSKKVTDHHALLPTLTSEEFAFSTLPSGEKAIYDLISRSVLISVCEPYRFEDTTAILICSDTEFTAKGKVTIDLGWKVYDEAAEDTKEMDPEQDDVDSTKLPEICQGDIYPVKIATVKEGKTVPPKHFTEGTLLSAMERAGVKETSDEVERKGLGTTSTRAAIIEKLIKVGFLVREKSKKTTFILSTPSGNALISILPENLQSPLLTAEWENELLLIERGEASSETFLHGIRDMVAEIIGNYTAVQGSESLFPKKPKGEQKAIGKCPRCGSDVIDNGKGFGCTNRDCGFVIWKADRFFASSKVEVTAKLVSTLLAKGKVKLDKLYSPKKNTTYAATVVLIPGNPGEFVKYKLSFS